MIILEIDLILSRGRVQYYVQFLSVPLKIAQKINEAVELDQDLQITLSYDKIELLEKLKKQYPFELTSFLLGLDLKAALIPQIFNRFGQDPSLIKSICLNPYMLLQIEDIFFKKLDYAAINYLDISESSPLRLKYLIYNEIVNLSLKSGNLYILAENFTEMSLPQVNKKQINNFLQDLITEKFIVYENNKFYTFFNYSAEVDSAEKISQLIKNNILKTTSNLFANINSENYIKGYEEIQTKNICNGIWKNFKWGGSEFKLSEEQKETVRQFLKASFFIVTGNPGTGKSSVVKSLVDISKSRSLKTLLIAPTGIAAKRLSDLCDYEAFTIHRSLGFDGISWKKNAENPLDFDVIIVDEFSMVDQILFSKLLKALPQKKPFILVLVGDEAQLPSVGPGNVLKELLSNPHIPSVRLTQIFRQEETSDIILNAYKINNGDTQLVTKTKDFIFVGIQNHDDIVKNILKIVDKLKGKNFQVLSPTYKGILGVINLNNILQNVVNPTQDIISFQDGYKYRLNDKVMITKNDYKNDVYNGEQGVVKEIDTRFNILKIFINGKVIEYNFEDAASKICLDYIRTIHRSQGQEYDYVILPLVDEFSIQLQRNLLYTAVTRAKQKVFILGHNTALTKAILNNRVTKRNTILSERITQSLKV